MRNGTAEMGVIKMMKSAEFQARLNDRVDVERLSRLGAKVYTGSAGRALIDFRSGWNAALETG